MKVRLRRGFGEMSEFEIVVAHLAIAGLPATAGKPPRGSRIAIDHVFSTGYECSFRIAGETATADRPTVELDPPVLIGPWVTQIVVR